MSGDDGRNRTSGSPSGWPVELHGVTESVVTTLGPNGRWNAAALGLHAPDASDASGGADTASETTETSDAAEGTEPPVTARTYGRTRTWRNFTERGGGFVQFVTDPRTFVEAALTVHEVDEPVLPSADAWVEVRVEEREARTEGDTTIRTWMLEPVDCAVERTHVQTINRGFGAVIDATVAASRLDVPTYSTDVLLDRLAYFADVVDRCGGPREREAFARIDEVTDWRARR
ncbi:DUF447 domain-containing protein [Halorubrum vacuolatum]|uniref:DUF447 family protein n=1 Tax=Halorubrum vacuolatum TaxID=63740 RepID=A0A238WVM2_HALVU|nr:DUF447 domain-containing protein [Halorubrum vacuolatum]SNR50587.1 hypothetical protein SAMN06264855_110109 [Halorubrum vacuolatum]